MYLSYYRCLILCALPKRTDFVAYTYIIHMRAGYLVRIFSWPDTAAGRFPITRLYIAYIIYARTSMSSTAPPSRARLCASVSSSGRTVAVGDRINYRLTGTRALTHTHQKQWMCVCVHTSRPPPPILPTVIIIIIIQSVLCKKLHVRRTSLSLQLSF